MSRTDLVNRLLPWARAHPNFKELPTLDELSEWESGLTPVTQKPEQLTFTEWKSQVEQAYSAINYSEFCTRAGFSYDDYSERKWRIWQELARNLAAFDAHTLERIVTNSA